MPSRVSLALEVCSLSFCIRQFQLLSSHVNIGGLCALSVISLRHDVLQYFDAIIDVVNDHHGRMPLGSLLL